jgi:hypothetical protein
LVWGSGRAKKFQVRGNRSKKRLHRAIIKEGLGYVENGGHILSGEFNSLQFGMQYDGLSMKIDLNRAETVVFRRLGHLFWDRGSMLLGSDGWL